MKIRTKLAGVAVFVAAVAVALALAPAAYAALFPQTAVSCVEIKNKRTAGYSVGCVRLSRTGLATYINGRSVAVVETRTGRVVFERRHSP